MASNQSSIVNPKVLSLDPSSTLIGWAVMSGESTLIEAGLITPVIRSQPSYGRICGLRNDLRNLLNEQRPTTILIEWTKGKVGKRHHGRGAGLAVYGAGVGAMATECEHWASENENCRRGDNFGQMIHSRVIAIIENEWTRAVSKRERQLAIAAMFDEYRLADDPGGDMADAIGMAVWWFRQRNLFSH